MNNLVANITGHIKKHKLIITISVLLTLAVSSVGIPLSMGDGKSRFTGREERAANAVQTHLDGIEKFTRMAIVVHVDDVLPLSQDADVSCTKYGHGATNDTAILDKVDESLENAQYYAVNVSYRWLFGIPVNSYTTIVCPR
jgi:hypothetical protein